MEHWAFTWFFIFSVLVIVRNSTMIIRKLYVDEPEAYVLPYQEELLLGLTIAYSITYLTKKGEKNSTHKLVSFFNMFNEDDCNVLVEEIQAVIKWNTDVEEKNSLLELKMIELRKLFSENEVGSLRKLNFDFETKINLNEEQHREVVSSGTLEGPEGHPKT